MKYFLLSFILLIISVHNSYSIIDINENNNSLNKVNEKCNENCLKCENSICKKCIRGFYSFKNKCLNICPENYIADNFSFECKPSIGNLKKNN